MKLTFDKLLENYRSDNKNDAELYWVARCLMGSLTDEALKSGEANGKSYDFKLLVNGIELEPKLLEKLIRNVEEYIDREAKLLAVDKLDEALQKANQLTEAVDEAARKIREEFDLDEYES